MMQSEKVMTLTSNVLDLHAAISKANTLNASRAFANCIELLLPYLEANSDDHWLNFHLGRAYSGLGNYSKAVECFRAAVESSYPYHVGALYEIVRLDMSVGLFDRVHLLDDALALPGKLHERDEAGNQKTFYFGLIHFAKAILLLRDGKFEEADRCLEFTYESSRTIDERSFAFEWLTRILSDQVPSPELINIRYLKERLLHSNITPGLSFQDALRRAPSGSKVLEIGAMDGVRFDELHAYLKDGFFEGIVVEPVAEMFELLSNTYSGCNNVKCANVAIAERTGPLRLFRVSTSTVAKNNLAEWNLGISSAVKGPMLSYLSDLLSEEIVAGLTFEDFVNKFAIQDIDILQIDTEGYDWNILKQIDLGKYGVKLVQIEIIQLMPMDRINVFSFLAKAGYLFDYEWKDVVAVNPAFNSRE